MEETKKWYVVYTLPRWEKRVAKDLEVKGIEHYCPLTLVEKKWSDRKKRVHEPLFKGYVFVRLPDLRKWDIKSFTGIVNFVYWLKKPAIVKDDDILTIRKFLNEFEDARVESPNEILQPNDRVRVKSGSMMDHNGLVVEVKGKKARVLLQSMEVCLVATFSTDNLKKWKQHIES